MSKKSTYFLFDLIKSMSGHEKRYFKLYATRHVEENNNNQLRLFEAIDEQEEYDEPALIEAFNGEKFTRRFSVAKSRLYGLVMKSLHAYHATSSVDAELKMMLHMAEILFKKTLYRQCDRILQKAKKLALTHNKHTTLLEIRLWEKRIVEKDNYTGQDDATILHILEEDLNTIETIKNYYTFWNLKSRFFLPLYKGGKVRNLEEKEKFNKILKHPLLQSDNEAISVEAKYLYHHIYSAHYFSVGDYEMSYKHMITNLDLIEDNYILFKEEPNTYFSILANVIYIGNQLGKDEEVKSFFGKLKEFTDTLPSRDNADLEMRIFNSMKSLELTIYVQKGEYDMAMQLLPEIEEGLKRFDAKLSPLRKADFIFNIAILYFGMEMYSDALKHINRILNESSIDENEDLYSFSKFMSLILHYELGHFELLAYQTESTYRYLKKRNRAYKTEQTLVRFFKRLSSTPLGENDTLFEELNVQLKKLSEEPLERPSLEYFDFFSWIESKLEGKRYADLVKRKNSDKDAAA